MLREDARELMASIFIVMLVFGFGYAQYAYSQSVTLQVSVQTTLTFTTQTNNFPNLTPGTPVFATTTLNVTTNNTNGWNVTLFGNTKTNATNTMVLLNASSTQITDQTQWIPGAATTSVGNAVRIASLINSQRVLAFRVMTASGAASFRAPTWWGSADNYVDNVNTLWGGIASSTVQRQIGNAGAGSYQAAANLNTVNYYLDVPASQPTGTYLGDLTFTATAN